MSFCSFPDVTKGERAQRIAESIKRKALTAINLNEQLEERKGILLKWNLERAESDWSG